MIQKFLLTNFFPQIEFKNSNLILGFFVNHLLKNGKKELARKIIYNTIQIIFKRTKKDPYNIIEKAVKNVSPVFLIKKNIHLNKKNSLLPFLLTKYESLVIAVKWIIFYAKKSVGKKMAEKMANEIIDAANNLSDSCKKKKDMIKELENTKSEETPSIQTRREKKQKHYFFLEKHKLVKHKKKSSTLKKIL
jgi:small subunit ribosomal protein S7